MKQTRDSLLNLSGTFKQRGSIQFNDLNESPKRKKASFLVAAAVFVDTGVSEPTANMDKADFLKVWW